MNSAESLRILPVPVAQLSAIRARGCDLSGTPVETLNDAADEPLRCCLRNARAGEEVILFRYEPPLPGGGSPYREAGAILAHAQDCGAPDVWDSYPTDWQGRPQVLRAYDHRGWIHPASTMHDGSDPVAELSRLLAVPGVVEVHSRNVVYGCFMFIATASVAC
jgi:hypothetical protein